MAAAEGEQPKPLSKLPELVPAAVFMEDVDSYMQGAPLGAGPPCRRRCHRRRRRRRRLPPRSHPIDPSTPAGRTAEEVLNELRSSHQKYKYIEAEIVQRKKRLAFKQVGQGARPLSNAVKHGRPGSPCLCMSPRASNGGAAEAAASTHPHPAPQPEIRKCLDAVNLLLAREEAGEQVGACCGQGGSGKGAWQAGVLAVAAERKEAATLCCMPGKPVCIDPSEAGA